MRLDQLQRRKLITESWNEPAFTLFEQKTVHPWITSIERYVVEAQLSQDQINNLFTGVEQGATASGGNRTAIGKGADVAKLPVEAVKWINNKVNELGKAAKETGPVKNIDAKFAELKTKIGEKDNNIVKAVKAVSDWAKANPGKASIAVAILTAAAAIAGGPLGGAVAGFLTRATKDLLQGEDLSTAVGKSAKTAAIGALVGMASDMISTAEIEAITDGGVEDIAKQVEIIRDANLEDSLELMPDEVAAVWEQNPNLEDYTKTFRTDITFGTGYGASYEGILQQDQIDTLNSLSKALKDAEAIDTFSKEANEAAIKYVEYMRSLTDTNSDMNMAAEYLRDAKDLTDAQLEVIAASKESLVQTVEQVKQAAEVGTAAAQGAATAGVERGAPQESVVPKGQKLSEGQVYLLFNRITNTNDHMLENRMMFESVFDAVTHYNKQELEEGPMDVLKKAGGAIKKGAKAAGGAIAKGAKAAGGAIAKGAKATGAGIAGAAKQVTTKVTAEKLMTAWKKAGAPTDSDEVYNVIKGLGVADDVIKGTYDSMKIKTPSTAGATADPQEPEAKTAQGQTPAAADTPAADTPATDTPAAEPTATDEPAADPAAAPADTLSTPGKTAGETPADDEYDPKGKVKYKTGGAQGDKVKYDTGTPATNDKVDNNKDGKDDTTGYPMGGDDNTATDTPAAAPPAAPAASGGDTPTASSIDLKPLAAEISKLQKPIKDKIKQQLVAA